MSFDSLNHEDCCSRLKLAVFAVGCCLMWWVISVCQCCGNRVKDYWKMYCRLIIIWPSHTSHMSPKDLGSAKLFPVFTFYKNASWPRQAFSQYEFNNFVKFSSHVYRQGALEQEPNRSTCSTGTVKNDKSRLNRKRELPWVTASWPTWTLMNNLREQNMNLCIEIQQTCLTR